MNGNKINKRTAEIEIARGKRGENLKIAQIAECNAAFCLALCEAADDGHDYAAILAYIRRTAIAKQKRMAKR